MRKHIHLPTQTIQSKLIKYNVPVMITKSLETKELKDQRVATENPFTPPEAGHGEVDTNKNENTCQDSGLNKKETEHLLNAILAPKDWVEGGVHWRQSVSSEPASRQDMIKLEDTFNDLLKDQKVHETGLCRFRRALYSECLDEIIRQITVTCAERGLILIRIRDEYRQSFAAAESLYSSSSAYGMRKALLAEYGRTYLANKVADIAAEKRSLEKSIRELDTKMDEVDRGFSEKREADEKRHFEEIKHMKRANHQLKLQLESIVAPPKKLAENVRATNH